MLLVSRESETWHLIHVGLHLCLNLGQLLEVIPNVMALEILTNSAFSGLCRRLVELHELLPLNTSILVDVVLLEQVENSVVIWTWLLSSASFDKLGACLFCHCPLLIGVHVEPVIEDGHQLGDHLAIGTQKTHFGHMLFDVDLENCDAFIVLEAQIGKSLSVLNVLDFSLVRKLQFHVLWAEVKHLCDLLLELPDCCICIDGDL